MIFENSVGLITQISNFLSHASPSTLFAFTKLTEEQNSILYLAIRQILIQFSQHTLDFGENTISLRHSLFAHNINS